MRSHLFSSKRPGSPLASYGLFLGMHPARMGRFVFFAFLAFGFAPGATADLPEIAGTDPVRINSSLRHLDKLEAESNLGGFPVGYNAGARGRKLASPGAQGGACTGSDSENVSVTIDEYTLEAKFSCAPVEATLSPTFSEGMTTCHGESTCATPSGQSIADVLQNRGGKLTKAAPGRSAVKNDYTISLFDMPSNRQGKVYYKCSHSSHNCIVTVNLPTLPAQSKPTER